MRCSSSRTSFSCAVNGAVVDVVVDIDDVDVGKSTTAAAGDVTRSGDEDRAPRIVVVVGGVGDFSRGDRERGDRERGDFERERV